MKKNIILLITLVTFTLACKKPSNSLPVTTLDTYQPVTKNSYWKYHTTATPNHPFIDATITMTGEKETIGNLLCDKFSYSVGGMSKPGYFYHGNDTYLSISNIPPSNSDLVPYLKDNFAIGQTWQTLLTNNNICVGRIVEKGIKHTVNNKEFKDVIHTQLLKQYSDNGVLKTFQTINYYIAKGIGIIEVYNITSEGPENTTLQEYAIK